MNKTLNDLFKRLVLIMHGKKCVTCPCRAETIHHLYPKGMGGANLNTCYNPLNGVPVCNRCHTRCHDEIGEKKFREEVFEARPRLLNNDYRKIPLLATNEREAIAELRDTLECLS